MLRIRIRDPGTGAFLNPGISIRDGKKSGSGMNNPRPYSRELGNYFLGQKILKFFYADPDPGSF
jgi:hypothetical protein